MYHIKKVTILYEENGKIVNTKNMLVNDYVDDLKAYKTLMKGKYNGTNIGLNYTEINKKYDDGNNTNH